MDERMRRQGIFGFLALQEGLNDEDSTHLRSFLLWLSGSEGSMIVRGKMDRKNLQRNISVSACSSVGSSCVYERRVNERLSGTDFSTSACMHAMKILDQPSSLSEYDGSLMHLHLHPHPGLNELRPLNALLPRS